MKKLRKLMVLLLFGLMLVFLLPGLLIRPKPVSASTPSLPESSYNEQKDITANTLFILSKDLINTEAAAFYQHLNITQEKLAIDTIFSDSLTGVLTDNSSLSQIAAADKVIIIGLLPSKQEVAEIKGHTKADSKLYFVATHSFYANQLDTAQISVLSAHQLWIDLYYAKIADIKQLNFNNPDSTPTSAAGLALAIYLQYHINGNPCADTTYTMLSSKADLENKTGIDESFYNSARRFITESYSYPADEKIPALQLKELVKPELINQYTEKSYDIFKQLYHTGSTGIFSMEQTTENTPVSYDAIYLDATDVNEKIYSWNGSKWTSAKSGISGEYVLRVLTWSSGKWNKKLYRFSDGSGGKNPLKTNRASHIQRDEAGNWYMSLKTGDNYYIAQLDKTLKVKYKVNVSALTDSRYSDFYLLTNGKVILETYESTANNPEESMYRENLRLYNNLQQLDLKSGKITKEYEDYYPYGYVKIKGGFIYMRDKSKENIIIINSDTGEAVHRIHLADYDYLINPYDYSEELGSQYDYDYAISGNYLYLLKKSGIYKIDLTNGKFRKIMDDSYIPFGIQDMRFLDFEVKNSSTLYIMAVNFDAECATDFYIYTK